MTLDMVTWLNERIDSDEELSDEAGLLVLAALESDAALDEYLGGGAAPTPPPARDPGREPTGAFIKSLHVEGFRGVGERLHVAFQPAPGLTIVAGRNGSGKSSLAEALELALTGTTYRWKGKTSQWREHWRNLHHPTPACVRLELAEEEAGVTIVGVDWADAESDADVFESWVQRAGAKREPGTASLGWEAALDVYRPLMSYDELGGLLEAGPSSLYDALSRALGVEQITDAIARLEARAKSAASFGKDVKKQQTELRALSAAHNDARAARASTLLKSASPDIDELRRLITGAGLPEVGPLQALHSLNALSIPPAEVVAATTAALRDAVEAMARAGEAELERRKARIDVLKHALAAHDRFGDMSCPVCAKSDLDARWAATSRDLIAAQSDEFAALDEASQNLEIARQRARRLIGQTPPILDHSPLPELAEAVTAARTAWSMAALPPHSDIALADHIDQTTQTLRSALADLHEQASAEIQARQDAWAPLAGRLASFCNDQEQWLARKPQSDRLAEAAKWLKTSDQQLKNERLAPIADAARHAWAMLRQESNVELGSVKLEGTATRRRVTMTADVDGEDAGALSVMSQGELHALSLALFLPRASMAASPFRFLVLDDPVQAMDPAKVDGLVQLLAELAETRQVIVLSHDDRLAAAARRGQVGARILEVSRGIGSKVEVRAGADPAARYLKDARSLARDAGLPDDTLRKTLPGLLRLAVETAARDAVFAARLGAGASLAEVESAWAAAHLTRDRVSLAIYGDVRGLDDWLSRGSRRQALGLVSSAMHAGLRADVHPITAIEVVESLVNDVRQGKKQ